MNIKIALKNKKLCRAIIGINPEEFYELLPIFSEELKRTYKEDYKERKRRVGWGGRKGALRTDEEKLFLILFYLKTYPTYDVLAFLYGVARSKPYYWVTRFLRALEKALGRKLVLPKRRVGDLEELLKIVAEIKEIYVDGTERRINRPKSSKNQKKYYSGKKKAHTMKNTVITDDKGRILFVGKTVEGKRHDKKLYDDEDIGRIEKEKYGDTGYIGGKGIITPKKKPRGKELSEEEKEENSIISSFRVIVEHGIGAMKFFGIVGNRYRNRIYGDYDTVDMNMKDKIMAIVGGLANLKRGYTLYNIN